VENPQTLATGEAPGVVSAVSLPDWRALGHLLLDPFFSSTLPCYPSWPFEHKKLVPEANAPSHGWLVIEKIGRGGTGGELEAAGIAGLGIGATSAEKCRTSFHGVSLGAQQVSPGTGTGTGARNITTPTCQPEGP